MNLSDPIISKIVLPIIFYCNYKRNYMSSRNLTHLIEEFVANGRVLSQFQTGLTLENQRYFIYYNIIIIINIMFIITNYLLT